jgi:peptide/nickel transport system permease protein
VGRFAFVAKRVALTVPLLLGVVLVVFLLLQITPGDPAREIAGLRASEESLAEVRDELGLDDPVFVQYGRYVSQLASGDLGYSYKSRESVNSIVGERIEPTVWLLATGTLLAIALAVPVAILAALRRDRPTDHAIRLVGLVGLSMPAFWVGVMLLLLVALPTGLFPVGGFGGSFAEKLRSIALPALTLAIGTAPVLVRNLRVRMIDILDSDYVATAQSIGLSRGRIIRRFVLRNAASSSVTLLALEIGFLLFGAVVIETTFAIHGLGEGLVVAARGRDLAAVQGYTLLFALAVVAVHLAADVINAWLDPRVEIES